MGSEVVAEEVILHSEVPRHGVKGVIKGVENVLVLTGREFSFPS